MYFLYDSAIRIFEKLEVLWAFYYFKWMDNFRRSSPYLGFQRKWIGVESLVYKRVINDEILMWWRAEEQVAAFPKCVNGSSENKRRTSSELKRTHRELNPNKINKNTFLRHTNSVLLRSAISEFSTIYPHWQRPWSYLSLVHWYYQTKPTRGNKMWPESMN